MSFCSLESPKSLKLNFQCKTKKDQIIEVNKKQKTTSYRIKVTDSWTKLISLN